MAVFEFLVDEILDMRRFRRKKQFLIKWTGYTLPSWENEDSLRASPEFGQHLDIYEEEIRSGVRSKLKHLKSHRNSKARPK